MSDFIQRKVEVEEPEASATYKHGAARHMQPIDLEQTNLFFIGPRASGKSTLARAVAERLGLAWVDTDEQVEQTTGQSIAQLVHERGWEAFRRVEHEVLTRVCARTGQVVATGGGIVLDPENRSLMQEKGRVFYLMADVPLLTQRLQNQEQDTSRPPLSEQPLEQEIAQVLSEREPLYFQTLHFFLPANRPVQELVLDVLERLGFTPEDTL